MRPRHLKLLFSACSVLGGSFLYVLVALDPNGFEPALIGPLLGFPFGATLVLVTLWRTPRRLPLAYRRESTRWRDLPFAACAFLAPFSAGFMVWITGMMLFGSVAWLASISLSVDWPEGSGWAWAIVAWFFCAQTLTFRNWPTALESAKADPHYDKVRNLDT